MDVGLSKGIDEAESPGVRVKWGSAPKGHTSAGTGVVVLKRFEMRESQKKAGKGWNEVKENEKGANGRAGSFQRSSR